MFDALIQTFGETVPFGTSVAREFLAEVHEARQRREQAECVKVDNGSMMTLSSISTRCRDGAPQYKLSPTQV